MKAPRCERESRVSPQIPERGEAAYPARGSELQKGLGRKFSGQETPGRCVKRQALYRTACIEVKKPQDEPSQRDKKAQTRGRKGKWDVPSGEGRIEGANMRK